ncbi:hypothetical protein ACFWNH_31055 [Rhodococcus qingshengii]|uniref:hypothetical protein n=1 Tax=Rhodococcus qingshengii TaxID=334542 RepID=UPI00364F62BC
MTPTPLTHTPMSCRRRSAYAALAVSAAVGVLAGCGADAASSATRGADTSTTTPAAAYSGTTRPTATVLTPRPALRESDVADLPVYESVEQMVALLNQHGVSCTDLTHQKPLYDDDESGLCITPAKQGLSVDIYGSFEHLAESVAAFERLRELDSELDSELSGLLIPDLVIGKNWTAMGGTQEESDATAAALGGTIRAAR